MSTKSHDDSLLARAMRGEIDRRSFLRQAGTLAASPVMLKGAAVAAGTAAAPVMRAAAQDEALFLTYNNEQ